MAGPYLSIPDSEKLLYGPFEGLRGKAPVLVFGMDAVAHLDGLLVFRNVVYETHEGVLIAHGVNESVEIVGGLLEIIEQFAAFLFCLEIRKHVGGVNSRVFEKFDSFLIVAFQKGPEDQAGSFQAGFSDEHDRSRRLIVRLIFPSFSSFVKQKSSLINFKPKKRALS